MKKVIVIAVALLGGAFVSVHAGNCSWVTAPSDMIVTGSYSVFSTTAYSLPRSFSFKCTPNTTATLLLNRGTNSASFANRSLRNGAPPPGFALADSQLSYNLYNPANQIWGDGNGGSVSVVFNAVPSDKVYDQNDGAIITAVIGPGQDKTPGTYTDFLTATLSFGGGGPVTATFSVTATILPECRVDTFQLLFNSYDPVAANATAPKDADTSKVNVFCTKSTSANVSLDNGRWSFGGARRMLNTANAGVFLNYQIYKDTSRNTIWDTAVTNGGSSTSKASAIGGGYTGFGRISPGQDVLTGDYRDTVQAVVNY